MRSWYNWVFATVVVATAADFVFGLDVVLHVMSVAFVVSFGAALAAIALAAAALLIGIVARDAADEIRSDRASGRPWRWRIAGWTGVTGILVDGAAGAWSAYQQHILFSTAVEQIPFAGIPVLIALGSYPLRWIEEFLMTLRRSSVLRGG